MNKSEKQQLPLAAAAMSCRWQLHRLQWNDLRFGLTKESKLLLWAPELHINNWTPVLFLPGLSVNLPSLEKSGETYLDFSAKSSLLSFLKSIQNWSNTVSWLKENACIHSKMGHGSCQNLKKGYWQRHCTLTTVILHSINVCVLVLSLFPLIGWISGFKRLIEIIEVRHLMFRGFYHWGGQVVYVFFSPLFPSVNFYSTKII